MEKYIFIDNRMRDIEKEYLKSIGYILIEIPKSKDVYPEISSHVDIFGAKINDTLFLEPSTFQYILDKERNIKNIVKGSFILKSKYPHDIAYNVCQIGNNVIHNFKYTDSNILNYIDNHKLNKIHINQGYSKCSIVVVDSNSAIVTDKKIAKELEKNNIEVLCLEEDLDIKLFNEVGDYSNMKGFIGGCICRIENKVIVFGDLNNFKEYQKIKEFINKKRLEIVDFKGLEIIDYGGIVDISSTR